MRRASARDAAVACLRQLRLQRQQSNVGLGGGGGDGQGDSIAVGLGCEQLKLGGTDLRAQTPPQVRLPRCIQTGLHGARGGHARAAQRPLRLRAHAGAQRRAQGGLGQLHLSTRRV